MITSRDVSRQRRTEKLNLALRRWLQEAALRDKLLACVLKAPYFGHFRILCDHKVIGETFRHEVAIERCHVSGFSCSGTDRNRIHNLPCFLFVSFLLGGIVKFGWYGLSLRHTHRHLALTEPGKSSWNRLIHKLFHHVMEFITESVRLLACTATDFASAAPFVYPFAFTFVAGARLSFLVVSKRLR